MIARFLDKYPFSIKAIVPQELSIHPQMTEIITARDLPGLEEMAKQPGFLLHDENLGKVLFFYGQHVATYIPCGFTTNDQLWSD